MVAPISAILASQKDLIVIFILTLIDGICFYYTH